MRRVLNEQCIKHEKGQADRIVFVMAIIELLHFGVDFSRLLYGWL